MTRSALRRVLTVSSAPSLFQLLLPPGHVDRIHHQRVLTHALETPSGRFVPAVAQLVAFEQSVHDHEVAVVTDCHSEQIALHLARVYRETGPVLIAQRPGFHVVHEAAS